MASLDTEKHEIIIRHMRMARGVARRFVWRFGIEYGEAVGIAYLGLCEAGVAYDGRSAAAFGVIARQTIRWRLYDCLRSRQVPLVSHFDMDCIPHPGLPECSESTSELASTILNDSPRKQRAYLESIMHTETIADAARLAGVPKCNIEGRLKAARRQFRMVSA